MLSAPSAGPNPSSPSSARPNPPAHPSEQPFYLIPGVSNFRDIGGWPISPPSSTASSESSHVRRHLIFRGGDTTRIAPQGIQALVDLNVRTDFDLRSAQQIVKTGGYKDMSGEGVRRVWAPVFGDEEYTEEKARERYELYASEDAADIVTAFIEILTSGATMMRTVMRHLLDSYTSGEAPPALFMHCTTGNNRTGIFISLLLFLLHVPRDLIVREYTLSERGLAPTRHINVDRLLKKGAFQEHGPEEARRRCERMVGARAESMEALLDEVRRRWSGAEGYFRDIVGLRGEEIQRLRQILTAKGEGDLTSLGGAQL
ncbi:putative tyrosine-protein phosphatase [Pyrenochaeta sp. DS3sAY3a]|nr:putative tyrosine-protein phosphatase [Pyrenochaeta sp. DS3sAY3a]